MKQVSDLKPGDMVVRNDDPKECGVLIKQLPWSTMHWKVMTVMSNYQLKTWSSDKFKVLK